MAESERKKMWERFDEDVKDLAAGLRRHYEQSKDDNRTAALKRSLEELRQAAESAFKSIETATRDPEVRSTSRRAAQSFGSALARTFRELGDEIDKAVRRRAQTK